MKRSQAQNKLKQSSKTTQAFHDQGETDFSDSIRTWEFMQAVKKRI